MKKFRVLEKEISKLAVKYAKEYLSKQGDAELEQMTQLYKILILPEKSIKNYL